MELALVHDYLLVMRGAERTFAAMADVWPDAPIFTLLYDEEGTQGRFAGRTVITSPLQRLGVRQRSFRALLPLFPAAIRSLRLFEYDQVLSSSSAFAHGVRVRPGAYHVCYCHSPFRYAWLRAQPTVLPTMLQGALKVAMRRHRTFDRRAAALVNQFVANSEITAERIERYWGRPALVVHPPVEVERFKLGDPQDYVLYVGELISHKRPDRAIAAAVAAGRTIKVVGDGPERAVLTARYGAHAEFLGRVDDEQLAFLYSAAAALIVPNVEEFGIAAVEAQAAGRPVIAVDAGGARETVVPGRTGILVSPDDEDALAQALASDLNAFDPQEIQAHAQLFSRQVFQQRIFEIVTGSTDPS